MRQMNASSPDILRRGSMNQSSTFSFSVTGLTWTAEKAHVPVTPWSEGLLLTGGLCAANWDERNKLSAGCIAVYQGARSIASFGRVML
jgi:hypothetical protein